jgi:hypothetical protein
MVHGALGRATAIIHDSRARRPKRFCVILSREDGEGSQNCRLFEF